MSLEINGFYDFGDFRLDLAERVLLRDGKFIPITPKVFETLLVLVQNAGRIIEKEELMREIWQNRFVEESNLTFNIGMLRKALGDDASHPRYVETVPRRGYRFIAGVSSVAAVSEPDKGEIKENNQSNSPVNSPSSISSLSAFSLLPSPLTSAKSSEQITGLESVSAKSGGWRHFALGYRLPAAFALTALLIGAGGLVYYFFSAGKRVSSADGKKTIAVLPLKPLNAENRDEIYEVGIADSLIHRLSSTKGIVVRPLSATRKYEDINLDPLAAGREQEADYVLASNYQLAGGKIRVITQLLNVVSGQIEDTYKSGERDTANIFSMQDEIAGEIGNSLLARFAATTGSPATRRGTNNEEAYRLYLQGMYLYAKRTPRASKKAVELFDQAIRLDPNYALAWAGKAHAHRYRGNLGRDTNTHEEYQNSAVALNEALLLDKDLSEAHSALCENKYYYEWDFAGAERACRQAIWLDSNSSIAHEIYGRFLSHRGRFDEAISELKIAVALDPTSLFNRRTLGIAFYYAGRYDEAVAQFKQIIATDENFTSAYLWLRSALEMQGNYREAFEWFLKSQKALTADEATIQTYQTAYQTSGYRGVLREQAARFEKGNNQFYIGAILNAQIGNKEKAIDYLEKSYARREWGMNSLLIEPHLAPLRGDVRFEELISRVGLR